MRNGHITTKGEMYRLLYGGRFGNYPRAWESLEAVLASGYGGHVSIRSLQTSNPVKLYHVPAVELPARVAALPPAHAEIRELFCKALVELKRSHYGERFKAFELAPSPDGIGQVAIEAE
jgi:hypothetical protein